MNEFLNIEQPDWTLAEKQLLSQQIIAENLPHALLIQGVKGIGKLAMASWLAQSLLCNNRQSDKNNSLLSACRHCKACLLFEKGNYPDSLIVQEEGKSIGVDPIRAVSHFLEKKAQLGNAKTVIIESAEKMTISAANALLKTLEEPSPNTYLILLTEDYDRLLPTITSRCRLITIRPVIAEKINDNPFQSVDMGFVNMTHLAELTNEELLNQFASVEQSFIDFLLGEQNKTELLGQLLVHERSLFWLEMLVVSYLRGQYQWISSTAQNKLQLKKLELDLNHGRLWKIYQLLITTNRLIASLSQANRNFLIEKLLIDIYSCVDQKSA